jgi:serine phosphatase RsbU (regulator of sigma subunit)
MSNSRQNTNLNLLSKGILLFLCLLLYAFSYAQQSNEDIDQQIIENNTKAANYIKDGKINAAAELYNQSAYLLRQAERLSEAADLYKKVLEINTDLGNRQGQMISHSSLAMVYLEAENYPKALYHLYKELDFRKQIGNKSEIINVMANIALAENEMMSFDSAIENIENAIALAKELNDLSLLKRCYGVAYDVFSKQGNNNEKAHSYFELYSTIDRKLKEQKMTEITTEADQKVTKAFTEKQITENKLSKTNQELEKTVTSLQKVEELTREQQMELELKESKISEQKALIETKRLRIKYLVVGIGCLFMFIILLTFMILKIRRANKKINQQRSWLEKQNKEIKSSISYAQTIQQAMLPANSEIERYFESFILYLPKDIVSGDFYWISTQESRNKQIIYFAMVDCTGHGVPGAFMSMIGNQLLNEIVKEKKVASPAEILEILNLMIRKALRQEQTDNNDGMDLALCKFEKVSKGKYHLVFSGAKRPIYIIKNTENKLINLRGDRKSIGGYSLYKRDTLFNNHNIDIEKGDLIYMFSDGILDQNNPDRKKFGRIRLEEALIDCAKLPPLEQKKIIEQRLNKYIDNEEQRDDITLIGLKII